MAKYDSLVADFIEGARRNPRLGQVQIGDGPEVKLARLGTPLDVAHVYGTLCAMGEAGVTLKQASEQLQIPADVLQAVLDTVKVK